MFFMHTCDIRSNIRVQYYVLHSHVEHKGVLWGLKCKFPPLFATMDMVPCQINLLIQGRGTVPTHLWVVGSVSSQSTELLKEGNYILPWEPEDTPPSWYYKPYLTAPDGLHCSWVQPLWSPAGYGCPPTPGWEYMYLINSHQSHLSSVGGFVSNHPHNHRTGIPLSTDEGLRCN